MRDFTGFEYEEKYIVPKSKDIYIGYQEFKKMNLEKLFEEYAYHPDEHVMMIRNTFYLYNDHVLSFTAVTEKYTGNKLMEVFPKELFAWVLWVIEDKLGKSEAEGGVRDGQYYYEGTLKGELISISPMYKHYELMNKSRFSYPDDESDMLGQFLEIEYTVFTDPKQKAEWEALAKRFPLNPKEDCVDVDDRWILKQKLDKEEAEQGEK